MTWKTFELAKRDKIDRAKLNKKEARIYDRYVHRDGFIYNSNVDELLRAIILYKRLLGYVVASAGRVETHSAGVVFVPVTAEAIERAAVEADFSLFLDVADAGDKYQ